MGGFVWERAYSVTEQIQTIKYDKALYIGFSLPRVPQDKPLLDY